jgi:hypothetical protein
MYDWNSSTEQGWWWVITVLVVEATTSPTRVLLVPTASQVLKCEVEAGSDLRLGYM